MEIELLSIAVATDFDADSKVVVVIAEIVISESDCKER